MKNIILRSHLKSDLNWERALEEARGSKDLLLWEFDFGFLDPRFCWQDTAVFFSLTLALEEFSKAVFPEFKDKTKGVVLFKGSVHIFECLGLKVEGEEDLLLEGANFLADYMHRLASFLPDEIVAYCFFISESCFSKGKMAQLLSKDRFWHLGLRLEEESSLPVGVLLPSDTYCLPPVLEKLTEVLDSLKSDEYRIIPEGRLNELWEGLDTLIVIEDALSAQGKRQLQGFEAAGGEVKRVRSRGI